MRRRAFESKFTALDAALERARSLTLTPAALARHGIAVAKNGTPRTALDLLRLDGVDMSRLAQIWPELRGLPGAIAEQVEIEARYSGYLRRQEADIVAYRKDEGLTLPDDLNFSAIGGLSRELREKLAAARPATLGAASRISGMTPAALVALLRFVRRGGRRLSA